MLISPLVFFRFTNECVIISGATKVKPPCELQLASMSALTSKTSSQAFFLRTLKVIIQLRDAIRLSRTKKTSEYFTIQTKMKFLEHTILLPFILYLGLVGDGYNFSS